jgi:hypothetical protein
MKASKFSWIGLMFLVLILIIFIAWDTVVSLKVRSFQDRVCVLETYKKQAECSHGPFTFKLDTVINKPQTKGGGMWFWTEYVKKCSSCGKTVCTYASECDMLEAKIEYIKCHTRGNWIRYDNPVRNVIIYPSRR